MKLLFPSVAFLLLVGCAISERQSYEMRKRSLISGICALHHKPLLNTTAFRYTEDIIIDPTDDFLQLDRDFPNAILLPYATERTDFFTKPGNYRYCPKCQEERTLKAELLWKKDA